LLEVGELDLDEPAGPPGATVRHLLAHASGLNFEGSAQISAPGQRRVYSNGGFELLGELIAKCTGQSVGHYLREAVFEPLDMRDSTIDNQAATGGRGPVRDLLAFARELLAPRLVDPETLGEATSVVFPGLDGVLPGFGRQANNDWGLGFEIRDGKRPHWTGDQNSPTTFGHFGQQGSFLWVDPVAGIACAVLTGAAFGPWAAQAWPPFSDAILAEYSRRD
jgi:CubicO group peptidase (beta-lactamase class C family)